MGDNQPVVGLGDGIRRVRESLNLTLVAVAERALKDVESAPTVESFSNYLSKVELGTVTNPSLEFLERVAKGLGLTLSDLFARVEGKQLATAEPHVATGTPDGRPISSSGGLADPVNRTFILTIVEQFVAAVDRLIAARSEDRQAPRSQAVRRRRG